jgi:hypothetical protein
MSLNVAYCSRDAALMAVSRWHYSKCLPTARSVKFGVWEQEKFIGVVIFGDGVSPSLGTGYGLEQREVSELTRVALGDHQATVSKILSVTVRFLRKENPGLKLLVSYADPDRSHHGGIYQASNWIYQGQRAIVQTWFRGKWRNDTTVQRAVSGQRDKFMHRKTQGKHKYVLALCRDKALLAEIEKRREPYPKRVI